MEEVKQHRAGLWDTSYSDSLCLQEGRLPFLSNPMMAKVSVVKMETVATSCNIMNPYC